MKFLNYFTFENWVIFLSSFSYLPPCSWAYAAGLVQSCVGWRVFISQFWHGLHFLPDMYNCLISHDGHHRSLASLLASLMLPSPGAPRFFLYWYCWRRYISVWGSAHVVHGVFHCHPLPFPYYIAKLSILQFPSPSYVSLEKLKTPRVHLFFFTYLFSIVVRLCDPGHICRASAILNIQKQRGPMDPIP